MSKRGHRAFAILVAHGIEVTCPACGEPQPNPGNGGDGWLVEELQAAEHAGQVFTCPACDLPFGMRTFNPTARIRR